jgi:hypothetical protein
LCELSGGHEGLTQPDGTGGGGTRDALSVGDPDGVSLVPGTTVGHGACGVHGRITGEDGGADPGTGEAVSVGNAVPVSGGTADGDRDAEAGVVTGHGGKRGSRKVPLLAQAIGTMTASISAASAPTRIGFLN